MKARFRAADARHRAVRRAYNAYHVAGLRRVYECTPDDTGLFPSRRRFVGDRAPTHPRTASCAPLRVAHVVLGSRCDGDDAGDDDAGDAGAPHDRVGDRVDQCERCRRWTRRYPPQGVAACSGGHHGPCNEAQAHAGAWKARRAVLIRALHRHVNRRVVDQYQLHGARTPGSWRCRSARSGRNNASGWWRPGRGWVPPSTPCSGQSNGTRPCRCGVGVGGVACGDTRGGGRSYDGSWGRRETHDDAQTRE